MQPRFNGRSKFHPVQTYPMRWDMNRWLGGTIEGRMVRALIGWHLKHGRPGICRIERGERVLDRQAALRRQAEQPNPLVL